MATYDGPEDDLVRAWHYRIEQEVHPCAGLVRLGGGLYVHFQAEVEALEEYAKGHDISDSQWIWAATQAIAEWESLVVSLGLKGDYRPVSGMWLGFELLDMLLRIVGEAMVMPCGVCGGQVLNMPELDIYDLNSRDDEYFDPCDLLMHLQNCGGDLDMLLTDSGLDEPFVMDRESLNIIAT